MNNVRASGPSSKPVAQALLLVDVHRLGRTARAGNEGKGYLVLSEWEQGFLTSADLQKAGISKSILKPHPDTEALNDNGKDSILEIWRARVDAGMRKVNEVKKEQAYVVRSLSFCFS